MDTFQHQTAEQPDAFAELWAEFSQSASALDYYQGWLALQSRLISGVIQGLLLIGGEEKSFSPVAAWPRRGSDPTRLSDVMERVLEENCGLLLELEGEGVYAVAYPLLVDDKLCGVVALEIVASAESDLRQAMEQLQWGIAWLELLVRRRRADEDQAILRGLKAAVDLLAVVLGEEGFSAAAMSFTTELAAAGNCERVSLGFCHEKRLKLESVSHSADVGGKMNLTRHIEKVMDEAILQRREIAYPPLDGESLICREHEALSRQQAMASIVTFPLYNNGRYYAALTCERGAGQNFDARDLEFFRAVVALAGPALESKFLQERPLRLRLKYLFREQLERLSGSGYYGRKLALTVFLTLVGFFGFAKGDYHLRADMSLEGAVRRAIVVPFDGFIDEAPARAGDPVDQGALLCSLDDRDLRLEKLAKSSEYRQLERQYQEAVSRYERAKANIIKAQLDQAQAELDLLEAKLSRTRLAAPFSGLVVSGDLSQRLGSAVEKGEALFEITPLDAYRVILEVDERRIADARVGQKGILVLSSLPEQEFRFTVTKVTPLATAEEGRNYFRVEAALETVDQKLRPGMEGVGKIYVDRRKLISIWTRDMLEWVELTLWKWLP
jgi:RND family efflux transporter MFP subunit